jgi:MFS transporter, SP family, sugar:H+ symporter
MAGGFTSAPGESALTSMRLPHNKRAILLAVFVGMASSLIITLLRVSFSQQIRLAFGGFLFGYDIGVISGCLIMPDFQRRFGHPKNDGSGEWELSASRQSVITSLLSAGTFVGALAQAFTSDGLGRRGSILFWAAIFTIGTAIQTATERSVAQITIGQYFINKMIALFWPVLSRNFVTGRFIAGLGVGAMSAIVPLYNGETAPKAIRGFLLVMYQLQIIVG